MTSNTRILLAITTIAIAIGLTGLTCGAMSGCHQEQVPINPVPGWPCGTGAWHECKSGGCCFRGEECSPRGGCIHVGEPTTWGALPDAGAERQRLSPEDARKAPPR